ncbi:MAG: galactose-1-phosphate uridylyltransferase [Candidatus Bathyarchaeia archaeon]
MELRWDPLLREWIIVSGVRRSRPMYPEGYCPFCPGAEEVPLSGWRVLSLPNRFPSLVTDAPTPDLSGDRLYRVRRAQGACEIVVYTPQHNTSLAQLAEDHVEAVVDLWAERFKALGSRDDARYVLIFENKGREVGVTLDHPHGQIYAFPFIPPRIERELTSSRSYWKRRGDCLFCRILEKERAQGVRLIAENESFTAFLPFFARLPYGVHIYPRRHLQTLLDFTAEERRGFALILRTVLKKFDRMFEGSFPYMMVFHQAPTDGREYPYYHFHAEFYPPYRERGKLKFFASVETGAGTVTFDYRPEDKAEELRDA